MEIKKKDLQRKIESMLSKKYKSRLGDAGFITFFGNTTGVAYTFGFRLQFDCMLTFTGFTVALEKLEHFFSNLLLDELGEYYDNEMVFSCYEFYPQKYEFVQEITSEAHLEEFLSEFYKCLSYYEQEVFPKPLAIKVKLNDLRDNMDITRLVHITEKDTERLNKYLKAYQELKACL